MARTRITLACIALVAAAGPASADESHTFVIVPMDCASYWQWRGDTGEQWNRFLSFAACAQDASVRAVDDLDQLPTLVEDLQAPLVPTLELYLTAVQRGPGPVKIRAGFQMAMTQVALITRARSSIKVPDIWTDPFAAARFERLHAELEPRLEESAFLSWMLLLAVDRGITENPSLASDPVVRNMGRMARQLVIEIGRSWRFPRQPETPLRLAAPS
jgi:hypothetical protein